MLNGAASLVLWLRNEAVYIFNEFGMVIKFKWNCWAEGICNPITLMSPHKGKNAGDLITLALVSTFNVRGCSSSWSLRDVCLPPITNLPLMQVSEQIRVSL